jgi:NCAIR mutase (PurE)-related protein
VIIVAGMDAALPTVVGGLVGSVVVAVPTSNGYGVAAGGMSALHAVLASCSPGLERRSVCIERKCRAICGRPSDHT